MKNRKLKIGTNLIDKILGNTKKPTGPEFVISGQSTKNPTPKTLYNGRFRQKLA